MDRRIHRTQVTVTTAGGAGVATGSATTDIPVVGEIINIHLNYHASCPATADVTIAPQSGTGGNILAVANNATDGYYAPRLTCCDTAAGALTWYDRIVCQEPITVSVAQADALTGCLVATIWWKEN